MGKGGDATQNLVSSGSGRLIRRSSSVLDRLGSLSESFQASQKARSIHNDLVVLKNIWLKRLPKAGSHAARLEHFYSAQASQYDNFRKRFLHGRKPMLAACAARLNQQKDMIWVDLGGGTGENVAMMEKYLNISESFKKIYVVDLCSSLLQQAQEKVKRYGWKNVEVVEADACEWNPPEGVATLVTFSYSLSMIPNFHAAVDRAVSFLDQDEGLLGICDFYTPSRYDLPLRQMSWARRFFWQSVFDMDNIVLSPERRAYLDHSLSRVWEFNDDGPIPYVPFLRAPYYVAVYRIPKLETLLIENKAEAPPLFPPTFLYTQSWEDPRTDAPHLKIDSSDTCLTLTSGGCNSLELCLAGAKAVYSVDCNPAQNALLELKAAAIRRLDYEDFWKMFGEGKHPNAQDIYEKELAPFLTQNSLRFWKGRVGRYFRSGLFYRGGMGKLVWYLQFMCRILGLRSSVEALCNAQTIEEQRYHWEKTWIVRLLRAAPQPLLSMIADAAALLLFNRITLWFGCGVPIAQYQLIKNDGIHMSAYAARTLDGAAQNSLISKDNYFYYNCLMGHYKRDNCPNFLTREGFQKLKEGAVDKLFVVNAFFLPTLQERIYTKVILMDHLDWMDLKMMRKVANALRSQVAPGGRVIFRSAAFEPPYVEMLRDAGFTVKCLQRADKEKGGYMDRVNMYASFYLAIKN